MLHKHFPQLKVTLSTLVYVRKLFSTADFQKDLKSINGLGYANVFQ